MKQWMVFKAMEHTLTVPQGAFWKHAAVPGPVPSAGRDYCTVPSCPAESINLEEGSVGHRRGALGPAPCAAEYGDMMFCFTKRMTPKPWVMECRPRGIQWCFRLPCRKPSLYRMQPVCFLFFLTEYFETPLCWYRLLCGGMWLRKFALL